MLIAFDCRIIRDKNPAGIARVVLELLKKLLVFDKKNDYALIFDSIEMKDFIIHNLRHIKRRCKIFIVPFGMLTWQNIFYMPKVLEDRNTDIFYVPYYFASPFFKKTRLIITVFDLIHFFYPGMQKSFTRKMYHYIRLAPKMVFAKATKIVTISMNTSRDLVRQFKVPTKKIKLIPMGVSDNFRVLDKKKTKDFIKEKFNVTKSYILYVGRNEPHKNIKALVLAYYYLPDDLKDRYQLIIAGKEDIRYGEPIRDTIKRYGLEKLVTFTGYVDESDLPFIYNGASVFVFPSFYEGFGLPILEAMACGVPVVASNYSSLPEVGGEAALYADPYDVKKISKNIESILSSQILKEEMIKKGFEQVKNFTWFSATNSLIECFEELRQK
ncbi:glycosyltransferase family 4 protein [Candidatus Microgenomates bacterium]|nr:glycosyltransferase family 4 protein [Candidatus Microgenomates bacterium]